MKPITKKEVKKLLKEFHKLWLESGEPDPSSNDYLNLNRSFFYAEGLDRGIELAMKFYEEEL